MKCPDCKDGFYYPLVGPPEPCQTCAKSSRLMFPLDDFKNHLMERLKNIDFNSVEVIPGIPSQNDWYISQILGDAQNTYNNRTEAYAAYFYGIIKSAIIQAGSKIKLDFSESIIDIRYDVLKCGIIMTIYFSMEIIK